MTWRAILAIASKDVLDAIKNLYLLFALVLPVAMSLLFRFAMPTSDDLGALTIAVHDPGGSRLVAGLREMTTVRLVDVSSSADLPDAVERQAVGGLAVPAGFDAAVAAGGRPELAVYLNHDRGGGELAAFQRLMDRQVWAQVAEEPPARIIWTDVGGQADSGGMARLDLGHYLLVLLIVMSLSMTGVFVVPTLLVEEKEKHTLDALLVSPAGAVDVVVGKALVGLLYSALGAGVLMVLNRGFAGAWPLTVLAVLLGSLFCVGVGLLMGSAFQTSVQVNTWSSVVMLVLMIPSWLTTAGASPSLDFAMRLIPTSYLARALAPALAGEVSLPTVGAHLAVLAGCAAVVYLAVVWLLRRDES